ncbi:MAG: cytochrome b N-terminal domain-containing protein, partial [Acidimicrobiales bacterium]
LSITFGSPNDPPLTLKTWATAAPVDFATTAVGELQGTTLSATYGPPYNTNGTAQHWGFVSPASWIGVTIPIHPAQSFVLDPLSTLPNNPSLTSAIATYNSATSAQQQRWDANYTKALGHATTTSGTVNVKSGDYGPVPVLVDNLVTMARSGALDATLEHTGAFYSTDFTKPLLFLADGSYFGTIAQNDHLLGTQWGMMNETGSYPGQPWLWLYTMWYQVTPFSTSANADLLVMMTMLFLTAVLALVPFIPGLRRIPEKLGIYRIIWRKYYRDHQTIEEIELRKSPESSGVSKS